MRLRIRQVYSELQGTPRAGALADDDGLRVVEWPGKLVATIITTYRAIADREIGHIFSTIDRLAIYAHEFPGAGHCIDL